MVARVLGPETLLVMLVSLFSLRSLSLRSRVPTEGRPLLLEMVLGDATVAAGACGTNQTRLKRTQLLVLGYFVEMVNKKN